MKPWELEEQWHYVFGRRLRSLASRNRMPLTELSRRSGISYFTLYGYVAMGRRVPAYAVVRLAQALEISVNELLEGP